MGHFSGICIIRPSGTPCATTAFLPSAKPLLSLEQACRRSSEQRGGATALGVLCFFPYMYFLFCQRFPLQLRVNRTFDRFLSFVGLAECGDDVITFFFSLCTIFSCFATAALCLVVSPGNWALGTSATALGPAPKHVSAQVDGEQILVTSYHCHRWDILRVPP